MTIAVDKTRKKAQAVRYPELGSLRVSRKEAIRCENARLNLQKVTDPDAFAFLDSFIQRVSSLSFRTAADIYEEIYDLVLQGVSTESLIFAARKAGSYE